MKRANKKPVSDTPLQSVGVGNPARLALPLNEEQLIARLAELGVNVHGSGETYTDRLRRR